MTILVSGYYGFGNEGDELILEGLLRALAPWRPQITVLSADPAATQARHRVRAASRWQPAALWRELRRCRVLISGGGGLVQDGSGPFSPSYYLGLVAWAQKLGKRTVAWGQGFVPLRWAGNRWLARRVLRRVDLVLPRDPESAAWCQDQGLEPERVQPGGDLAWLRPWKPGRPGRTWAVCLRADRVDHEPPAWLEQVLALAQASGRRLRFVALGNRGDRELLERLRCQAPFQDCGFVSAPGRPDRLFAGTELVLSQRYHGLILGIQAGAVIAGFGQDLKIARLLHQLGQLVCDPVRLGPGLRRLHARRTEYWQTLHRRLGPLLRASRQGQERVREQLRAWGVFP